MSSTYFQKGTCIHTSTILAMSTESLNSLAGDDEGELDLIQAICKVCAFFMTNH